MVKELSAHTFVLSDPVARERCRAWLRDSIAEIGISQAELGRRIGLERDQVHRLLHGKRRLDPDVIHDVARVLRLPPPDISAAA
jgi:transcriptional regulator with XRE-family HTH domain